VMLGQRGNKKGMRKKRTLPSDMRKRNTALEVFS